MIGRHRFALALGAIAVAALALRAFYVLHWLSGDTWSGDAIEFHLLADTILESGSYSHPVYWLRDEVRVPSAEKPPGFAVWLAGLAKLGVTGFKEQAVACGLLGATTVVLTGLLGRRVGGVRLGLMAAAIAAVYPMLFMIDGSMRSETLYVPLVAGALLAAYRMVDRPKPLAAALVGLLLGLAALTRSEAVLLLLALGVPAVLLAARAGRLKLKLMAAMVAACLVVVGPWLARNWIVFDRPTAISTNEGGLLRGANCRASYYGPLIGSWGCFPHHDPRWGRNEAVISSNLRAQAIDYARDNAGRLPAVAAVRFMRTWDLWSPYKSAEYEAVIGDRNRNIQIASVFGFYVLVLFAAGGAILLRRRGVPLRLLLAPIAFVSVMAVLTYGSTRFRAAAEVPLVILCAVAVEAVLVAAAARVARRRRGPTAEATAA